MTFERWRDNPVGLGELSHVLAIIMAPPNPRSSPRPGDRQDRHFDQWFDGGAIVTPTGGASEYFLDNGIHAQWAGLRPRLFVSIAWPDGRSVSISQTSDHTGSNSGDDPDVDRTLTR